MSWWQTAPSLIAACAVFFLPGLAAARSIGLKGLAMWASAPAITVSLAGVGAVAAGLAGIGWNIIVLLAVTAVTVLLAVLIRLLVRRGRNRNSDPANRPAGTGPVHWGVAAAGVLGFGVAAFLLAFRLVHMFGAPENISQTYDSIFHLNAVRYAFDTGNGSSLLISGMTSTETPPTFYPAAWHDMVVLLMQLTGVSIPVAISICNIVVAALMWPLGAMFLASRVLGTRPVALIVSGILSTGFAAFPFLLFDFGVLYPLALSLAILPVALGLAVSLMRVDANDSPRGWIAGVAFVGVLPGMALAHPSSVVALLGLAAPAVVAALLQTGARLRASCRTPAWFLGPAAGVAAYAAVIYCAWVYLRPAEEASFWGPFETEARAIGEALTSAPLGRSVAWFIFLCTALGLVQCLRRPAYRWLFWSYVAAAALFVVAAAAPMGDFRWAVVGVWYNDPNRLAALLPIVALPVAAVGCTALVEGGSARLKSLFDSRRGSETQPAVSTRHYSAAAAAVFAVVGAALLSWLVQGQSITEAQEYGEESYRLWEGSALLTADEAALLERVDEHVDEDATVIGSPWTGASLVYAFADRRSLTPFVYGDLSATAQTLLQELNQDAPLTAEICDEVTALDSFYVLDFGSQEVHNGDHAVGPENIGTRGGYELVDAQGNAKLYRISACG